jgi:hypothetical protein
LTPKIKKFLADAAALVEKINACVKKRDSALSEHISERVKSGIEPDLMHIATSRDAHVLDLHEVLTGFLTGLDLSEALSPTRELGHPPVDEEYVLSLKRQAIVIGKKPEVYVYINGKSAGLCLRDYMIRSGVDADTFMSNPDYEIVIYNVDQLVANEIYRIPDGSFTMPGKELVLAEAWADVSTLDATTVEPLVAEGTSSVTRTFRKSPHPLGSNSPRSVEARKRVLAKKNGKKKK